MKVEGMNGFAEFFKDFCSLLPMRTSLNERQTNCCRSLAHITD